MTATDHDQLLGRWADVISTRDWDRFGEILHPGAVVEFPQSGERFRGIDNIRATFEQYPDLGAGTTTVDEVIYNRAAYALTPSYTLIEVDGGGDRGLAVSRIQYPDGTLWWALNIYELREGLLVRIRSYFAQDFDAPAWRAPFREAP